MKLNIYQSVIAFISILLIAGTACQKEKAGTPTWIEIDSLKFNSVGTPLTSSSRYTDAWVYVNSNLVGAFELPARIPVLAEGPTNVIIFPGIQVNGLTALRSPYIKIKRFEQDFNLVANQTIQLNPVFTLDTAVTVKYVEKFETNQVTMQLSPGAYGSFGTYTSSDAFEGAKCGILQHDGPENTITQSENSVPLILPKGDVGGVYLEMNYKCNTSFTVSLLCTPDDGGPTEKVGVIGINASDTWKKIYIALSPTVNAFTTGNKFKIAIAYTRNLDIPIQQVYIDNVQILY